MSGRGSNLCQDSHINLCHAPIHRLGELRDPFHPNRDEQVQTVNALSGAI